MATQAPPAPFDAWTFEKTRDRPYDSPESDVSASTFFGASSDKLRITPTMEDIRAALKERPMSNFEEEYQSSEEALSPMLDGEDPIESSQNEADDELDMSEENEGNDTWEELRPFKIDMAVALCIIAVGRPKVINLPPRWANFRKHEEYVAPSDGFVPTRIDSLPPVIPIRNRARTPVPRLDTQISVTSMPTPTMETPQLSTPPESIHTTNTMNRKTSIYSESNHQVPQSLTPPLSDHSSSDSHSFLQSDPFETTQPFKRTHSRLRSFSSRFKPLKQDEPAAKALKRERRVSLIRRPATPPVSFFDNRSSNESARPPSPATMAPPAFIALRKSVPEQRKMVARAANEREPAIMLPPCPPNYDQDLQTLRRGPIFGFGASRANSSPTVLKRRSTLFLGA